ncbi:MAG: cytochrome c biogenesis protein CcsA [Cyclobacteriaceae bacterium]
MLGNLGHLSVTVALVSIAACIYAYVSSNQHDGLEKAKWLKFAQVTFIIHGISVITCIASLYSILYFHHYEYQYAWKHSSNSLPFYFILSCFWEGQEGSFLIWIFWNAILGGILLKTTKDWESSVLPVFGMIQFFLLTMVLGAHFSTELKIGSSPFLLLKDTVGGEIFNINPNFIPVDGTGLNPLLQNIWMVIHPPIIFLGFALSGVPFAFAIAAMWKLELHDFSKKATPWLLITVGVLGIGIMMGAYWAYETLNFGGYWNWDPVENAVLIPWLVLLAAVHGTVLYRRKRKGLALTLGLSMTGFLLVLYSTFLTRSGILGDSSVHSFTDLGLSGQLLLFLLFFVALAVVILVYRKNELKGEEQESPVLSLDFWMITGICVLCLSAFQILLPTSFPVINVLLENIGVDKNFAPPADQVMFYANFQVWFAVVFCLLAGLGQVFYWRKIKTVSSLESELAFPVLLSLVLTSLLVLIGKTADISYIILLFSAIYVIAVSIQLMLALIRNTENTSLGGLLAHVGMAVMLIGFVYSAGHKKVVSQNLTINAPDSSLPAHTIQENLLLSRNIPKENEGYKILYNGSYAQTTSGTMVNRDLLLPTTSENEKILLEEYIDGSGNTFTIADTIKIDTENTFYDITVESDAGDQFNLLPRMQNNPTMGYIASPDIKSYFTRDIYTHITNFPDPEKVKWNKPLNAEIAMGESFNVQGLDILLEKIEQNENPIGVPNLSNDIALEASILIKDQTGTYETNPIFHIDGNRSVRMFPGEVKALGAKIFLNKVDPQNDQYGLSLVTSQRDWITIKSIEMPFISLVWLGTIILFAGVGIAFYYRLVEAREGRLEKVEKEIFNPEIQVPELALATKTRFLETRLSKPGEKRPVSSNND